MSLLHRRVPHLVCHWSDGQLVAENYVTRTRVEVTPLILDLLTALDTWQPPDAVAAALPRIPAPLVAELIDSLVAHHLVDAAADPPAADAASALAESWKGWMPAGAFFHFGTKDVPFTPRARTMRQLNARAAIDPPPPALKPAPAADVPRVPLPAPAAPRAETRTQTRTRTGTGPGAGTPASAAGAARDALPDVLLARRTWRRFGTRGLTMAEIGTLLGLTWRVQEWIEVGAWGRMALKTAPSGGARHSIEAYLVARRVKGLTPGIYHYAPDAHELRLVRAKASAADIAAYLPRQDFYGQASALVLMTAVFPRVQWRYPFARAYRTVLAEAGHHCQTFCLTATWLDLAPFCTMALADTRIERDLGIDGVTESVIYAAGVGPRPAGSSWAPWPDTTRTPSRTANPARTPQADGLRARPTAAPPSTGRRGKGKSR